MYNKNSIGHGLLLGLLIPLAVGGGLYLIFLGLEQLNVASTIGFRPMFRERTIALIGIVANVLVVNKFNKKRFTESVRGVSIATFIYVVIWLLLFWKTVVS